MKVTFTAGSGASAVCDADCVSPFVHEAIDHNAHSIVAQTNARTARRMHPPRPDGLSCTDDQPLLCGFLAILPNTSSSVNTVWLSASRCCGKHRPPLGSRDEEPDEGRPLHGDRRPQPEDC
jgi:hypothetical protein